MDAGTPGRFDRLGGTVDVFVRRTRERAHGALGHGLGHRLDRLEVTVAGGREPGLDNVHAHALELLGDTQLFVARHGRARALLAVAKRGVKNDQLVVLHDFLCILSATDTTGIGAGAAYFTRPVKLLANGYR